MKTFLFVESPLQLLNAYEAMYVFHLKHYKIIIRLSGNADNDKQIKFLVQYLDIKHIKFLTIKAEKKGVNDYIKLLFCKYIFLFRKIDKVFIGNFDSGFFRLILNQIPKEKVILLDDGSKTLAVQNQFTNHTFYNFFTLYNIKALENQIVYKNTFQQLSQKLKKLHITEEEILFLGMKLSEAGIMVEEKYIKLVRQISHRYSDKKMIYITHRGESLAKLQKLKEIKNMTIKSYDYPIELLGVFENALPFKVVSFYSTALLTMKYIYKIDVECFSFDYQSSRYRETIDCVYAHYSKNLKVIQLDD